MTATIRSYIASSWPVLLPIAGLLGLSVTLFPSAGRDDAYITYWAAHALREFGEIANINGAHIEQSTSLLHVLVLGVMSFVTRLSVPAIGPPMSVLFGIVTVIYAYEFARLYVGRWYAVGAAMIVATAAPFVYWTTGGLEGTMTALAATALLYHLTCYLERPGGGKPPATVWAGMGVFLLARPEAIFVIASVLLAMFVLLRLRGITVADERLEDYALAIRKVMWAALAAAVVMAVIYAFKTLYFGDWLPQPVTAKLGGDALLSSLGDGTEYLLSALMPPPASLLPFFSIAGVIYLARRFFRDEPEFIGGLLLALYAVAYIAFIFLVGGDWMEGSRFIVPVIPALAVLAVVIIPRIKLRDLQVYAIGGIIAFHVVGSVWFAKFGSVSTPIWDVTQVEEQDLPTERYSWFARPNRTHLRDMPVVEELGSVIDRLQPEVDGKLVVMSGQAGFVPYHALGPHYGRVEFIDRRGVTTPHFTDCEITGEVERDSTGLLRVLPRYLTFAEDIERRCGVDRPHVIFELDLPELSIEDIVTRNGYVVVYRQTGKIQTSKTLQGIEVLAHEFIAVREDLARVFEGALPMLREWSAP
ncbi:MAG: glycosyltransferase family 39 protein [Chloroflexi bacterium]|nr:glycosyltransferase family 39 protein [Chloroflexota bacterium]